MEYISNLPYLEHLVSSNYKDEKFMSALQKIRATAEVRKCETARCI